MTVLAQKVQKEITNKLKGFDFKVLTMCENCNGVSVYIEVNGNKYFTVDNYGGEYTLIAVDKPASKEDSASIQPSGDRKYILKSGLKRFHPINKKIKQYISY